MCVIIYHQRKHKTIPLDQLQNAIHNNPHGVGLVRFGKKRSLLVSKHLPKSLDDGPDAASLHENLKKLENHSYILHLRNTTVGANNKENLHPFELYKGKNGHYVFMHNGTLHEFNDATSDDSDTNQFVQSIVSPLASMHSLAYPQQCFTLNKMAMAMIEKYRATTSRFMIISGDKRTLRLGDWTERDFGTCSNNHYFDRVVRGAHQKKIQSSQHCSISSRTSSGYSSRRVVPFVTQGDFWKDDFWTGPREEKPAYLSNNAFFQ